MGDVVSLVERATESIDEQEAERLAKKVQKGQFDMNDLLEQLRQISKMGGLDGLMAMLPGVGKIKKQMAQAKIDPKLLKRQEAIILSMTAQERLKPKLIHASRKKRIAAGSGTSVQEINRLMKQFKQMSGMMKKVSKMGKKGMLRQGLAGLGGPGGAMQGMPGMPGQLPPR
jgi:signal recognition particle subunit SRP54